MTTYLFAVLLCDVSWKMLLELCLSSWDDRSAFSLSLAVFLGLDTGCATLKKVSRERWNQPSGNVCLACVGLGVV